MRKVMITTMVFLCNPVYADISVKSDALQSNLIELYTSEGCSSCPPADQWLSTLKDHPDLWQKIIPMAFHVDYWNYIGWKDRFSQARYSDRQRQYAHEKSLSTVYTPGLVSNGNEWRNFSWLAPTPNEERYVGPLTMTIGDRDLSIRFEPAHTLATGILTANIVLLGFDMVSDVRSGENAGRKLHHDFVVLEFDQLRMNADQGSFHITTDRPVSTMDAGRYAIAAWVSTDEAQAPLQAVGAWLDE